MHNNVLHKYVMHSFSTKQLLSTEHQCKMILDNAVNVIFYTMSQLL